MIRLKFVGDLVDRARFIGVEAAHLVDIDVVVESLQSHLGDGLAEVVGAMSVGHIGFAIFVGDRDHQDGGVLCPGLIAFFQYGQAVFGIRRYFRGARR